jgi:hypothetical protein
MESYPIRWIVLVVGVALLGCAVWFGAKTKRRLMPAIFLSAGLTLVLVGFNSRAIQGFSSKWFTLEFETSQEVRSSQPPDSALKSLREATGIPSSAGGVATDPTPAESAFVAAVQSLGFRVGHFSDAIAVGDVVELDDNVPRRIFRLERLQLESARVIQLGVNGTSSWLEPELVPRLPAIQGHTVRQLHVSFTVIERQEVAEAELSESVAASGFREGRTRIKQLYAVQAVLTAHGSTFSLLDEAGRTLLGPGGAEVLGVAYGPEAAEEFRGRTLTLGYRLMAIRGLRVGSTK